MRGENRGYGGFTSAPAWLACSLFAFAVPAHAAAHRIELRDASLAASANSASLTLDLDRTTSYRLFTLPAPGRVVIDLADSRLARGAHLSRAGGIVQQLRAGARPHGGLRIVLQLEPSATSGGRVRLPVHAHWQREGARTSSRLLVTVGDASDASIESADAGRAEAPSPAKRTRTADTATHEQRDVLHPISAPHAPALADRDVVIAVDAGHGGKDPGAIGRHGTEEKNVTLAIARALAARINDQPGMHAVLTRDGDVFLLLRERMDRAHAAHADLFVSVHADSIGDPSVSGASVYVLSERGATNEAARILADRENAADRLGGISLADKSSTLSSVLLDLSQTASISASMTAAQRVLTALDRVGEVRKARVQQAGFVVLKSPDIPSMLVETAYISNPSEERRLRTTREQRKLADAIFAGLLGYFDEYPPSGTRFARLLSGGSNSVLAGAPGTPANGARAAVAP